MKPLVSVIIPVYNAEKYLSEAIKSVLAQAYSPIEIIVVDDGSTDNSAIVAQQFGDRIQYLYQENSGAAMTRNRGVEQSHGDYLSFLDADDLWSKNKIKLQLAAFEKHPNLDIVFGHVQQFFSPDLDRETQQKLHCPDTAIPGNTPSSMLVKSTAFQRVGLFSTQWRIGEPLDWYLRATELQLHMEMLPEVVLWRRIHKTNQGIYERHLMGSYAHILKASLDRRRTQNNQERIAND